MEVKMCQNLTKLLLAGAVAVALLVFGVATIPSPAVAKGEKTCAEGNALACIEDMLDEDREALRKHNDFMAFLISRQAYAFAFLTSETFTGDLIQAAIDAGLGDFSAVSNQSGRGGGLLAADALCNDLASRAGLPMKYFAWLATSATDDPESTFNRAPGPYILPNGDVVATAWDTLVGYGARLISPINIDETSTRLTGDPLWVWTNVDEPGSVPLQTGDDCVGWSSDSSNVGAKPAEGSSVSSGWTAGDVLVPCGWEAHLYCFGQ
jgi:hypothetical protein